MPNHNVNRNLRCSRLCSHNCTFGDPKAATFRIIACESWKNYKSGLHVLQPDKSRQIKESRAK